MHHAFDPERFLAATPGTEPGYAGFLGSELEHLEAVVLVAAHDGVLLGYTYARIEETDYTALRGPAGVLHDLVVDPRHRGHGIGLALLDATLAALSARGAPRVVLFAAERNEAAQHRFARAGFRRAMTEMTRELNRGVP